MAITGVLYHCKYITKFIFLLRKPAVVNAFNLDNLTDTSVLR